MKLETCPFCYPLYNASANANRQMLLLMVLWASPGFTLTPNSLVMNTSSSRFGGVGYTWRFAS